ncbi:MAG: Hsp20/alpha crystallin family protein [Syntrophales bacterium]|nr:Hsp20/alpha crystallin family protein [Syntrophales bacterium]
MFWPEVWRFGGMTEPLGEIQRLQREMNRLFSGVFQPFSRNFPPVNVWVGEEDAIITAEIPGMDPGKMDISVVGDTLTLSGAREMEVLKEGESYHRQERSHGRFTRTMQLPFKVDADKVEARYDKGALRITLPRAEEDKPQKVAIKSA